MTRPVLGIVAAAAAALLLPRLAEAADGKIDFNRDVRPILSDNCFACHGPAAKEAKGDLRLDQRAAATTANKDGRTAIVPGDAAASELVRRIRHADADKLMPPAESHKSLNESQKAILEGWIAGGAEYAVHWAFAPPVRAQPPAVKAGQWARNAIDRFVLARLEASGLAPSPEADRATLIRRVSYDLTGLPPTLEEVDAFVRDSSADAYEAMVDRYLAKPAFGERMALAWMDAARYGDSSVFHADGPRDMWGWRDWVIRAYNDNMPFDRFTIEQIAGDLLPNADAWQKVASGFNRNHGTTDEGGVIPEEARVDYVVDRVKTTANVWLGLSMECAQCHDHKYDPVNQREYYAFYAFFNQTTDPGMQSRKGNQAPIVNLPEPAHEAKLVELDGRKKALERQIAERGDMEHAALAKWIADETARITANPDAVAALPGEMLLHVTLDETAGDTASDAVDPRRKGKVHGKPVWTAGQVGGAFVANASTYIAFDADTADFNRESRFSYGCWVKPDGAGNGVPVSKMDDANGYRGWDLYISHGTVAMHLIQNWPADAIKVTSKQKIKPGAWSHVFVTYDGSSKAAGVKIYINSIPQDFTVNNDTLVGETLSQAPLQIGRRHPGSVFSGGIDDVRIYARTLAPNEVAALAGADPIGPILATPAGQRTPDQVNRLREHYLAQVDTVYPQLKRELDEVVGQIAKLGSSNVSVMVMQEQDKPRDTFLLMRGHYGSPDNATGPIKPAVPAVLGSLPEGAPQDRLGLARWLVSPEHPLTARVAVNRYWYLLFGRGIVATVMDFGSQGEYPTHPELLDHLAVDFIESGWDRKRMIKQIVMSATYRQASVITPQLAAADPENRLLARGPRFRLQGEFIRDTALAVSGLLVDEVGGPSVRPYQPPGLWEEVALGGAGSRFVQDKGEKLYRKSLYIYWKRSAPHPGMTLFDAPTREKCTVDRPRTNTPLQALYTMNDTQFVEAARFLAERMFAEGGATPESRIAFAHRLVTAREPGERAAAALASLYITELARYRSEPERAKRLLTHGEKPRNDKLDPAEHAALTIVASTILNMDATLTRY